MTSVITNCFALHFLKGGPVRPAVKHYGGWIRAMCDVVAGLEKTLEDRRKKHGPHHNRTMESMYTLAAEYSLRQMYREAEPLYRRLLVSFKDRKEDNSADVADSMLGLSVALLFQGKDDQAQYVRMDGLDRAARVLGKESVHFANVLEVQAEALLMHNYANEAARLYREALDIKKCEKGGESRDVATVMQSLANALLMDDQAQQAERVAHTAMQILQKLYGNEDRDIARMMHTIGNALFQQRKMKEAEDMVRKAIAMHVKYSGQNHSEVGMMLHSLGDIVAKRGRHEEASMNYKHAIEIYTRAKDADGFMLEDLEIKAMFRRAESLDKRGFEEEAHILQRQAEMRWRKID